MTFGLFTRTLAPGSGATPPARAPKGWSGRSRLAAHLFTLAFLVVWYLAALAQPPITLPGPWETLVAAWSLLSGDQAHHLLASAFHVVASIAIAVLIGGALAGLAHVLPVFDGAVHGRITPFLNAFSSVGWVMLAIVWFSFGPGTVIFAIAAVLVPFAIINIAAGLKALDQELLEMARAFSRSPWRRFTLVVLPALFPFLFATLRICFGVSWKVTLTAELFGGDSGIGRVIKLARDSLDTPTILAGILIILAIVYVIDNHVLGPIERQLNRHHGHG